MEKLVISHTDQYLTKFKTDFQRKAIELSFTEKDKLSELLEYIFEYEKISFEGVFVKKTKSTAASNTTTTPSQLTKMGGAENDSSIVAKNAFSDEERCTAMRKQGDRCTRKKLKGSMYCGTHCSKYTEKMSHPQGGEQGHEHTEESSKYKNKNDSKVKPNSLEVIAYEIQGIIYYIDKNLNVYNTEDIFKNINNPRIIAKAVQLSQNLFSIPTLGL